MSDIDGKLYQSFVSVFVLQVLPYGLGNETDKSRRSNKKVNDMQWTVVINGLINALLTYGGGAHRGGL